jgi:hypothetical protein
MSGTIERGIASAGAVFSDCERYRYRLWRVWDETKPKACFVMLNPSTADENALDPTVSRCKKRAEMLGYGGLEVVNLFALRSTDPKALYEADDPVGPGNVDAIVDAVQDCAMAICAWGTHGAYLTAGNLIRKLIQRHSPEKIHYLKLNSDGSPAHPLYLPYSLQPVLWSGK